MRLTHKIVFDRIKLILLFAFLSTTAIQAQTTDLEVQFIGTPPTRVAIGEAFAIQAQVIHVGASAPVVGETVTATLELIAPDGIVISTYVQSWNGFANPPGISSVLDNDSTAAQQVILQMPWTEASKIHYGPDFTPFTNDDASWTVSVRVSSPSLETNLSNNTVTHSIFVDTPDLRVDSNLQILAKHPQTGQLTTNLFPDSRLEVSGTITNVGNAITQPGARFTVEARLFEGSVTSNLFIPRSLALDYERIILPASDGSTEPTVLVNGSVPYTITNLNLPADAEGNFTIQIIADVPDQDNLYPPPGNVVEELEEFDNNHQIITFTVDPGFPELQINPSSYEGDIGTFNGLDPIRIAFAISNVGTVAINPNDTFTVEVALSTNDRFSPDDFILREFDLSGDALGTNLRSNETINLDWIQQLPDNLEGDYYMVAHIPEVDIQVAFSNTPIISIASLNEGETDILDNTNTQIEKPSTSFDGKIIVYERIENGIKQIYYRDYRTTSLPIPVTNGNDDSLNPKVSGDGSTIVFHSRASDLVPDDTNEHEDVFLFDVQTQQIVMAMNFDTNSQGNGGSFYPSVNYDGTKIAFESEATNLTQVGSSGRQVFLWDRTVGTFGEITRISNGTGNSLEPSINGAGNRIVFSSYATDLVAGEADNNGHTDIFLYDTNSSTTTRINKNLFGLEATGGPSNQPKISGNGSIVVFRSQATNLVTGKGVSHITVDNGGSGYFGNPTLVINDPFGNGEGAEIKLAPDAIDLYGQIRSGGIEIIRHGKNYSYPQVSIIPDPNFPAPNQVAQITAHLTHPMGEIYLVNLDDFLSGNFSSIKRVSENQEGVGGDMSSREPDISYDGNTIVYSTQASNLLDNQITRSDGNVYYNQPVRQAKAQAIVVGGIGEIEVLASGSGYSNGFLSINDVSGTGSGAIASYEVDSFGRISSIIMVNPGINYNIATTVVQVDNPRGGNGFVPGAIRFAKETGIGGARVGGGMIHRIEMVEHGMNYQTVASSVLGLESLISIDGDGVDSDNDGKPDAKVNPQRIKLDSLGGIYLEQKFDISVTSASSLLATTLGIEDANKSIFINFATTDSLPFTIGINNRSLSEIRDEIIDVIMDQWDNPNTLFEGPQIENNATGGTTFTLSALSGRVAVDNSSSVQITAQSNMLFSGSGYTRATPYISPPPTIHGFSEISSQTTLSANGDGRQIYTAQPDYLTDDIYLYDAITSRNERVSLSTFGFPSNYLNGGASSMPSNRFPSVSGDGRFISFSSDTAGSGGLAFDGNNQTPIDTDNNRDVFVRDRKVTSIPQETLRVSMLFPNNDLNHSFAANSQIPIVVQVDGALSNLARFVELHVNGERQFFTFFEEYLGSSYSSNRFTGVYFAPANGTHLIEAIVLDNNFQRIGSSQRVRLTINQFTGSQAPNVFLSQPIFTQITSTSTMALHSTGSDPDGNFIGIQYYVNGIPLGDEILRPSTSSPESFGYIQNWSPGNSGIFSIVAVGRDNSGNFVSSEVYNISATTGSEGASIIPTKPFAVVELNSSNSAVQFGSNGQITDISILNVGGVGFGYFSNPRIDISGAGSNAVAIPVIDMNFTSPSYGKLIDLNVTNAGTGYDQNSTTIRIIPVIQSVKIGQEAIVTTTYDLNQSGDVVATNYYVPQRYDGRLFTGSGYVTAPRFFPATRVTPTRLPLAPPFAGESSTSILNLNETLQAPPTYPTAVISGGFNHAPLFVEFNVSHARGEILEVYLLVNGFLESSLNSAPYAFSLLLDDPQEYSIIGFARDEFGNVTSSEPLIVDLREFTGSAPTSQFDGNQTESVQVGSSFFLTAMASSENGISNVEFFLDNQSLGFATKQNDSNYYSKIIDLSGLSEGPHQLSHIARDFNGNQVGSFEDSLTNIRQKINKTIRVRSSSNALLPTIDILAPRTENLAGFNSGDRTVYEQGSIVNLLLEAKASGVADVAEIVIYSNGVPVNFIGPNGITSSLVHDPNSLSHQIGRYEFSFEANSTGIKSLVPVVIDTFGNQYASQSSIEIEVKESLGSSPPVINLMSPYKSEMGRVWMATERDEDEFEVQEISKVSIGSTFPVVAFANDIDKDFDWLQFYVDQTPISEKKYLPLNVFLPDQFPYSTVWEANETGIFYFYAMGSDKSGNISISNLSTVQVIERFDQVPETPIFTGSRRLAKAGFQVTSNGGISINLTDSGYGYMTAPDVSIISNGNMLATTSAKAILDPLSRSIKSIEVIDPGNGYNSSSKVVLHGGFIDSVATGASARAAVIDLIYPPDPRFATFPYGIDGVSLNFNGFGYSSAPIVNVIHPTGQNAILQAVMGPSPFFGLEVRAINIVNPGVQYDPITLNKIIFTGGLGIESESFLASVSDKDEDGLIVKTEFLCAGGGFLWEFTERTLPPYNAEWSGPVPGEYHMFIIAHDNTGNISTSERMVQKVVNPYAPVINLAPLSRARASAQINELNGSLESISLDYNGSGYSSVPEILIRGEGNGARAVASIDYSSGYLTDITLIDSGSGYSNPEIFFMGGLEKTNQEPEVVLGETISFGVSATDPDGLVTKMFLIVNGDKNNPLEAAKDIEDPLFQPGSFQYNGSDPQYIVFYTPDALGFVELQVLAEDDEGKQTYSNPIRYKVTNGEPPVIEIVSPQPNSSWTLGYDKEKSISLVAKASDPDWAFNNDVNETSKLNGVLFFANDRLIGEGQRIPFSAYYSIDWRPTSPGKHSIVAVAIDSQGGITYENNIVDLPNVESNRGNFGLSLPVIVNLMPRDELEDFTCDLQLLPATNNNLYSKGSSFWAKAEFLNSSGKPARLSKVEFYLDGDLVDTQYSHPYGLRVDPPDYFNLFSETPVSWEILAIGYSIEGKTASDSIIGTSAGSANVPELTLLDASEGQANEEIYYDGTEVQITVVASGDDNSSLASLLNTTLTLYANGEEVGSTMGTPRFLASTAIDSISYIFPWSIDYKEQSNEEGKIQLCAVASLNLPGLNSVTTISSNTIDVKVKQPIPWVDFASNAADIFFDLTDSNPTSNEIQIFNGVVTDDPNIGGQEIIDWINQVNPGTISQKIDMVSAFHISMGSFHEDGVKLQQDLESFLPSTLGQINDIWLRSYIDDLLNRDKFIDRFGVVPYLVGGNPAARNRTISYQANRMSFVRQCYVNKYGAPPTVPQQSQGSKRMVARWGVYQTDYWELVGSPRDTLNDPPPRRDSLPPSPNNFLAGECAVDLIYNMAKEISYGAGQQYIALSPFYRESLYANAVLYMSLMADKESPFTASKIFALKGLSNGEALEKIINDPVYLAAYNLIFENSDEISGGWKQEEWFGSFNDSTFPWIYHHGLGWIYIVGNSQSGFWFYSNNLGWIWTGQNIFPHLYSYNNDWIYFDYTNTRFYNFQKQAWLE